MEKKKILVTGANGYIGHNVVKFLLDNGFDVIAADINIDNIDPRANVVQIDLFKDNQNFYELLGKPDACLHMAWRDGFKHNSEKHLNDLPYHYSFLKNLIDNGIESLSIMGSMHEIGFYEGEVSEDTPTNPSSLYGICKNALRQMMESTVKNTNTSLKWLRCYYIYGDDKNNHSIFTKLIEAEENGQELFPFTSGINKYDFTHIDDLVKMLSCATVQNNVNGIIECCSGIPVSLKDKVEAFIADNEFKIKLDYGKFPDRPYDSKIIYGNCKKINQILDNSELTNETHKKSLVKQDFLSDC